LVHDGARELEGNRTLGASIVRAQRRDRLLWTYTEYLSAASTRWLSCRLLAVRKGRKANGK